MECESLEDVYDRWEHQYKRGDWDYLRSEDVPRYAVIAAYMRSIGRPISLLDIGCGEGIILRFCEREWLRQYTGVDISKTAIDRIKFRLPSDRLLCKPLEEFDTDDKFDIILFNEVLYYMSRPEKYLVRFRENLSQEGFFLISMLEMTGWRSWRSQTAINARSVWHFINKNQWNKLNEVMLRDVSRLKMWRIALVRPRN